MQIILVWIKLLLLNDKMEMKKFWHSSKIKYISLISMNLLFSMSLKSEIIATKAQLDRVKPYIRH